MRLFSCFLALASLAFAEDVRQLDAFKSIRFDGHGVLKIAHGEAFSATLDGKNEEVNKQVKIYVDENQELVIVYEGKRPAYLGMPWPYYPGKGWDKTYIPAHQLQCDYQVTITAPLLESLLVSGAPAVYVGSREEAFKGSSLTCQLRGTCYLLGFVDLTENLDVVLSGSSAISWAGSCKSHKVVTSGSDHYDAINLESEQAQVAINGVSTVNVGLVKDLVVDITGSGQVNYVRSSEGKPVKTFCGAGVLVAQQLTAGTPGEVSFVDQDHATEARARRLEKREAAEQAKRRAIAEDRQRARNTRI